MVPLFTFQPTLPVEKEAMISGGRFLGPQFPPPKKGKQMCLLWEDAKVRAERWLKSSSEILVWCLGKGRYYCCPIEAVYTWLASGSCPFCTGAWGKGERNQPAPVSSILCPAAWPLDSSRVPSSRLLGAPHSGLQSVPTSSSCRRKRPQGPSRRAAQASLHCISTFFSRRWVWALLPILHLCPLLLCIPPAPLPSTAQLGATCPGVGEVSPAQHRTWGASRHRAVPPASP